MICCVFFYSTPVKLFRVSVHDIGYNACFETIYIYLENAMDTTSKAKSLRFALASEKNALLAGKLIGLFKVASPRI